MKKIYIVLTFLAMFFIGNISVSASSLKCTYHKIGRPEIVFIGGVAQPATENNKAIIVQVSPSLSSKAATECPDKIVGFSYISFDSRYTYHLFLDGEDDLIARDKKTIDDTLKLVNSGAHTMKVDFQDLIFEKNKAKSGSYTDEGQTEIPNLPVDPDRDKEIQEEVEGTPIRSGSVVSCGNGTIRNIPSRLKDIINTIVTIIQIGVPIVLIILGMIDFGKSAIAQKEDEMKKGQRVFISRLITALLVFFVILFVKVGIRFVNDSSESSKIVSCIDCFISGKCE